MENSLNNERLDEMRRRIQESLSQAKRDKLRNKYALEFECTDSRLSPEIENEWLEPVEKHFNVRTTNKQSFHLWYSEKNDTWHLILRSSSPPPFQMS